MRTIFNKRENVVYYEKYLKQKEIIGNYRVSAEGTVLF